jgi:uncharacterized protein involved in exopolysaccharide biosynthesis
MAETYTSRTMREVVRIVASRFVGIVLIFVLVAAAAVAMTFLSPKTYRSEVPLLARPGILGNPLEEQAAILRDKVSLFVITQREIIISDYVLASAMMRLENKPVQEGATVTPLAGKPAIGDQPPTPWYTDKQISDFIASNHREMTRLGNRVRVVTPGGPDATFTQTFKIRVDWLQTDASRIGLTATPEATASQATKLAGLIKDAYLIRYTALEYQRTREATQLLRKQSLELAKAALDEASADFNKFIDTELKGDLLQVINMVGGKAGGIETGAASLATQFTAEINKIDQRLAEVTAMKAAVDAQLRQGDPTAFAIPDAVTKSNPVIEKIQSKIIDLKLQVNALEPKYTESFQQLQVAKAELASALSDLRSELQKQSIRLEQEISGLKAQRDILSIKVAEDRKRGDELAAKVAHYDRLHKAVESAQAIYDDEQRRVVRAVTAEKLAANPVLVTTLDEPSLADAQYPQWPIVWVNFLVGGIAALILSLVYAFLADHFDHSIKSIDGAERYLGVPVLTSVPKLGRKIIRTK